MQGLPTTWVGVFRIPPTQVIPVSHVHESGVGTSDTCITCAGQGG